MASCSRAGVVIVAGGLGGLRPAPTREMSRGRQRNGKGTPLRHFARSKENKSTKCTKSTNQRSGRQAPSRRLDAAEGMGAASPAAAAASGQ